VVIAGALMVALPELLRFTNDLRMVIYGLVLVVAMMVMPRGIAGVLQERRLRPLRSKPT
jgi:ABC-type branched-subunit amino acid transport system permease subunit